MTPAAPDDDEIGKVYDPRLARRLVAYTRPYGWLVTGAVTLLLIEGALQLVGPLLTRSVIDDAIPAGDTGAVARATVVQTRPVERTSPNQSSKVSSPLSTAARNPRQAASKSPSTV